MIKALYVTLGSLSLGAGIAGIVLPGVPTTPFLLLSAALYFKSSERLYKWLINHKIFGKFIKNYRENKSLSRYTKIISIITMWIMITLSVTLFIDNDIIRVIVVALGITGTVFMLKIKTTGNKQLK